MADHLRQSRNPLFDDRIIGAVGLHRYRHDLLAGCCDPCCQLFSLYRFTPQADNKYGVDIWVATYPDQGPFGTLGVLAEAYACVIMREEHTVGNLF